MGTIKKVVMVSPIPASVSSSIQLLLFHGISRDGAVEYLSKEEVFSMIKYMMYKHVGEVLSMRFTPAVSKTAIVLSVSEVRIPSAVFKTEGFIEVNPFTKSIYSELTILENREEQATVKATVDEGYVVRLNEKEYEVRYYI
ncbi:MAG: hypothetical protein QXU26_01395 [Thermofilaceae archaeon]